MWKPKGELCTFLRDHVRKPLVSLGRDPIREELARRPPVLVDHFLDNIREVLAPKVMLFPELERLLENVRISEYRMGHAFL